tara:strand:- start:645 stop:1235 length:591 start_codon:yes stop_codon:yes gene_type:complete
MTLEGTNVDNLISNNGIYSSGLMKHNRFHVNMFINTGIYNNTITEQPVFAARVPGWDIATTKELNVGGNIKTFPMRKDWNQQLFVTFYMENTVRNSMFDVMNKWCNAVVQPQGPQAYYNERVSGNKLEIVNGDNNNIKWIFYEVYPRVLYPIELKPVEDFAPMVFSVQFVYRAFDLEAPVGNLIGTSTGSGGAIGT